MDNFINKTQQNFTIIENDILNNKSMSFDIKGLYCFLISKPSGWSFSAERIALQTNDSEGKIKRMLRDLEDLNLLKRTKIKQDGKFVGIHYEVLSTISQKSADGKTDVDKSADGNLANISNTDNSNTNNRNTNKEDIYTNSDFKKDLIDYGFKKELVNDWLVIRKSKGGVNTRVALNGFIKQIELHGGDKNELLEEIVSKSWAGFNINWGVETKGKNNPQSKPTQSNAGKSFYELAMEDYEKFKDKR